MNDVKSIVMNSIKISDHLKLNEELKKLEKLVDQE